MTDLSPQAQAIIGAISTTIDKPMIRIEVAAAVLRTLTCSGLTKETMIDGWVCKAIDVETILDIAAELEQV